MEHEEEQTIATLDTRVTVLEEWKGEASETLHALRRAADHIEVRNSQTEDAIKRAFAAQYQETQQARDEAKNAQAMRRAQIICAAFLLAGGVLIAAIISKWSPEAVVGLIAPIGGFVWIALEKLAPVQPKSTGRSIPPPPNANGRSQ